MALNKTAAPIVVEQTSTLPLPTPVADQIAAQAGTGKGMADKPVVYRTAEEQRVRGQVRMHAIIAGYKVGGALAATLGTSPASVKDELHKLAAEVADKIEAYSFED